MVEMKENIEKLVSISRRSMVRYLSTLMMMVVGGSTASQGLQSTSNGLGSSPLTREDIEPFEKIAKLKGSTIIFTASGAKMTGNKIHLDMQMVEQSIRTAIKQTQISGQDLVRSKLEHLLVSGTDAQKVDFVLGSGTYYFPEDVEKLAALSRQAGGKALEVDCHSVCEKVWTVVCYCRDLGRSTVQECKREARDFCHIVCP
jgi:hypothetical protein